MTMETIIFLLNHMLTYCITVDLGKIVLKCKYHVRIEQLFDRKSLLPSKDMYWENQPELPSDWGSNWSRGATRDIGSPPLTRVIVFTAEPFFLRWTLFLILYKWTDTLLIYDKKTQKKESYNKKDLTRIWSETKTDKRA